MILTATALMIYMMLIYRLLTAGQESMPMVTVSMTRLKLWARWTPMAMARQTRWMQTQTVMAFLM